LQCQSSNIITLSVAAAARGTVSEQLQKTTEEETLMTITKRTLLGIVGATMLAASPLQALADGWTPRKPIDFVIMAGPGGGADQIARFIQSVAEKKDLTNRPLVPNNKGGGSGAEALIHVSGTNDPDHTILVTLNSFFTTPLRQAEPGHRHPDLHADRDDGRRPVRAVGPQGQRHHHVRRVRRAGERMDGEFVMGGTGAGQEDSIVIAFMSGAYGLDIKYIPYDGGGAVAKDLAGQQIMAT
jgi:putative tricarboxylic transport membrane protein